MGFSNIGRSNTVVIDVEVTLSYPPWAGNLPFSEFLTDQALVDCEDYLDGPGSVEMIGEINIGDVMVSYEGAVPILSNHVSGYFTCYS